MRRQQVFTALAAAEGVILITTKKPKAGATSINFDMYTGIQVNNPAYTMLGSQAYANLKRSAYQDADPGTFGAPGTDTADRKIFNSYELQSIANGYTNYNWQKPICIINAPTENYTSLCSVPDQQGLFQRPVSKPGWYPDQYRV